MTDYISIIIQIILITVLSVIVLLFVRLNFTTKKEKRLNRFTIDALNEKPLSFFDKVEQKYAGFIKKLSKLLKKDKIIVKYSKRYEKYIDQTEKIRKDPIDFLSHKLFISFVTVLVTIISNVLRVREINVLIVIIALLLGFFIPDIFMRIKYESYKKQIENDLLKAVTIMNNAFKSGRSIMQAISLVSTELDGPISDEFKKMYIDLTYGLELELAFERFANRINLDEINYMASSLVILNKTGGNIVKVFDSIERGFFDRKKLKEELKSATALSKMVFNVLVILPVFIFLIIFIFNKTYFDPLFTTNIGRLLLMLILLIYILYIVIVKKITKMKE